MADSSNIKEMLESVLKNLKGMSGVDTVIGDPITMPDGTVIVPVSKLSFGFGGGGSDFEVNDGKGKHMNGKFGGGFGGGASVTPVTFLVINNGNVRLMPVGCSQTSVDKIIDMMPGIVDKVNGFIADRKEKNKE